MYGRDIKTQYIGSTSILLLRKGCSSVQTRSNAIILQETLPAYCIPKVVRMKTGEVLHEKVYMSPSTSAKDLIETTNGKENWVRKLLDNQKGKLLDNQKGKLLDNQKVPTNPTNSKSNS